jgi:hypothetical protein
MYLKPGDTMKEISDGIRFHVFTGTESVSKYRVIN